MHTCPDGGWEDLGIEKCAAGDLETTLLLYMLRPHGVLDLVARPCLPSCTTSHAVFTLVLQCSTHALNFRSRSTISNFQDDDPQVGVYAVHIFKTC
jgi:hypothetical protein